MLNLPLPKKVVLLLPLLYAVVGGYLWYEYGSSTVGLILWLVVQVLFVPLYRWLFADRDLGLMFKLHIYSMGIGMLILFYVLFPGRTQDTTGQMAVELVLMGLGTFCCAVGLFSMLYMLFRKLIADARISRRGGGSDS